MAINTTLRVSTSDVKSQASSVEASVHDIEKHFAALGRILTNTKAYWRGNAAEQYRNGYASEEQDVQQTLERMRAYPSDILRMVGVYEQTASHNERIASQLKTDVPLV